MVVHSDPFLKVLKLFIHLYFSMMWCTFILQYADVAIASSRGIKLSIHCKRIADAMQTLIFHIEFLLFVTMQKSI